MEAMHAPLHVTSLSLYASQIFHLLGGWVWQVGLGFFVYTVAGHYLVWL
jgi:hypothetical protein